jgi:hypothetical protein
MKPFSEGTSIRCTRRQIQVSREYDYSSGVPIAAREGERVREQRYSLISKQLQAAPTSDKKQV